MHAIEEGTFISVESILNGTLYPINVVHTIQTLKSKCTVNRVHCIKQGVISDSAKVVKYVLEALYGLV